jgi:hypothetical protein
MSEASQQAPKRTTPRGWLVLAITFGLLGIGAWGRATHSGLLEAIGFLPLLLALIIFMIRSDLRAKRDPEYARKLAERREIYRNSDARRSSRRNLKIALKALGILLVSAFICAWLTRQVPETARLWSSIPRPLDVPLLIAIPTLLATLWQNRSDRSRETRDAGPT